MWRKAAVLSLLLLPVTAHALDWSMDTGYLRRSFSADDQLGAVSPTHHLKLSSGQGPSIHGSVGGHTQWFNYGLRAEAAYLFLSGQLEQLEAEQPYKAKGKPIDTSRLAGPLLMADATAGFHVANYKVEVAGGVAVQGVGERWAKPFDFDAVPHGAVSVTFAYKGMDVTVTADMFFTPTVKAKGDWAAVPGLNFTFGKAAEVPLIADPLPVLLPSAPTPVALPKASTPTPAPAVLPEAPTPALPTPPTPIALPALPTPTTQNLPKPPLPPPLPPTVKGKEQPPPIAEDDPVILLIITTLTSDPRLEVEIRAFAETKAIAQARAEQARDFVVKRGVEALRIWAVGKASKRGKRDLEFSFAPKGTHRKK